MIGAIGRRLGRLAAGGSRRGPALSVIVPVFDVEAYLADCLDSLLAQSQVDLEVIVVDDGSTDGSPAIIAAYAERDARVRPFRQENAGQGPARNLGVTHARGEFIAFADADDLVPDGAYASIVDALRRSGSDFAVGAARRLERGEYSNPSWNAVAHEHDRIGITIDAFPAALADVIACNRVFRRGFWVDRVGGFPAGILYEDHEPMVAAYLRAERFDLLKRVVYTWRIRDDGTSTGQQKHQLRHLTDRVEVKRRTRALVEREGSPAVQAAWIGRVLDLDFAAYLDPALRADDEYRRTLREAYATYEALAPPEAMAHVRVRQKVRGHLAALGAWDLVDRAGIAFAERGSIPPTRIVDGTVRIDDPLDGGADAALAPETLELSRNETRLQACGLHAEAAGPTSWQLTGFAVVRGVDLDRCRVERRLWLESADGAVRVDLDVDDLDLTEATAWVAWPHGSFDRAGFRTVVDVGDLLARGPHVKEWRLRIRLEVDGIVREGGLHHAVAGSSASRAAIAHSRLAIGDGVVEPHYDAEHGLILRRRRRPRALERSGYDATAIDVDGERIVVAVRASGAGAPRSARLSAGDLEVAAEIGETGPDGTTPLTVPLLLDERTALPPGPYAVSVTEVAGEETVVTVGDSMIGRMPIDRLIERLRVRFGVIRRQELRIELTAPLDDEERSAYGQEQLRQRLAAIEPAPVDAVLLHGTPRQGVHGALRERAPALPAYWSVADASVAVPEGSIALVVGSREWYAMLGSVTHLCASADIGPWFRRRPHQRTLWLADPEAAAIGKSAWWAQGHTPARIAAALARFNATWDVVGLPDGSDAGAFRQELDYAGEIVVGAPESVAAAFLRPR